MIKVGDKVLLSPTKSCMDWFAKNPEEGERHKPFYGKVHTVISVRNTETYPSGERGPRNLTLDYPGSADWHFGHLKCAEIYTTEVGKELLKEATLE